MTPRQKELLDIIAASTRAAFIATVELLGDLPECEALSEIHDALDGIADDARAEHASGLLCEVFEELKDGAEVRT